MLVSGEGIVAKSIWFCLGEPEKLLKGNNSSTETYWWMCLSGMLVESGRGDKVGRGLGYERAR